MKVNDILNRNSKAIDLNNKVTSSKREYVGNNFHDELKSADELTAKQRLDKMLEGIDNQADRLSRNIDIKEVLAYKKLISEFLKETVSSMVKFSKNNFLDRRGRHRVYAIIKKVDEELEGLTEDVLAKEKDNIKILKRLDDIRGLILDIYL